MGSSLLPDFPRKFGIHINVELYISGVGSIKYLSKYVCKGSDRVTVGIGRAPTDGQNESNHKGAPTIDEIRHYQGALCFGFWSRMGTVFFPYGRTKKFHGTTWSPLRSSSYQPREKKNQRRLLHTFLLIWSTKPEKHSLRLLSAVLMIRR